MRIEKSMRSGITELSAVVPFFVEKNLLRKRCGSENDKYQMGEFNFKEKCIKFEQTMAS